MSEKLKKQMENSFEIQADIYAKYPLILRKMDVVMFSGLMDQVEC